jgi:hypothetical protein
MVNASLVPQAIPLLMDCALVRKVQIPIALLSLERNAWSAKMDILSII